MSAKRIGIKKDQQTSDDDPSDKDPKVVINSLDYDALAKIIMLLPIPERVDMEKVCTKWKEACQLAWYDVKKYKCELSIGRCYDKRLITPSYLEEILLRCGNYLKELSLSSVCNSCIMPFVSDHCKNLTSLECNCFVDSLEHDVDHFVQAFRQLDKLKCIKITVDHAYLFWGTINLSAIIDSLPEEINEIDLFFHPPWYQKGNTSMSFKKFKNLQKLTIHNFCLSKKNVQDIADITTLVYLSIGLFDVHIILSLFNNLVHLEYIDLTDGIDYDADSLSTIVLETIISTCKNLKHLDIPPGPYDVAEIPLRKWINFQNLEYLGITCNIMPDLANTIVNYCKNLKHLKIHYPHNIINETALNKLTELENLECLILRGHIILHEESITAISNNCKKLKRLEIHNCIIVSSIDGEPLSSQSVFDELSHLQYLEHLNLYGLRYLEDSTITAIANNCKNLKSLDIQCCRGITETGLDAISNLKTLQKLNVSHINIITDNFIIKLKGLKKLHCDGCKKLTDVGIIQFIKNNPDLEFLTVCFIDNITNDMVIGADQATKNRINRIVSYIKILKPPILQASKSIIKSQ